MLVTGNITVSGQQVQIWAGTGATPGPLVFYWHGTGGSAGDASFSFGTAQITAITQQGGVVASFSTSTGQGSTTGNNVWYTGDFAMADQIVACGIQQHRVDPCRIYTTGASAGGLQTTWMSYARSGYIAAAASLSGGMTGAGGFNLDPAPQDATHVTPGMAIHGAQGVDVVGLDFAVASAAWEADIKTRGGFSMDCNTGGGHVSGPPQICPAILQFFLDHPFKIQPEPYKAPLPSVFPSYCAIGPRGADGGAP
jgi:poly(3-hydroxybutyrate) depolymerase